MSSKFDAVLGTLSNGSNVAVVTMTGSCCPVTLGHVQGFVEARKILLGQSPRPAKLESFHQVLGMLNLNGDGHVAAKLKAKGEGFINFKNRSMLIELATADLPWMKFSSAWRPEMEELKKRWPALNFVKFNLNGADDVAAYQKWKGASASNRLITMGRPGYTQKVLAGMKKSKINPDDGTFIMGPDLPDISSTAVRKALHSLDMDALRQLLHPDVLQWCLEHGPYKASSKASSSAAKTSEVVRVCTKGPNDGSPDAILSAFQAWDSNKDGFICEYELRQVLSELGHTGSVEDFAKLFTIADKNQDGQIDYNEFITWAFENENLPMASACSQRTRPGEASPTPLVQCKHDG